MAEDPALRHGATTASTTLAGGVQTGVAGISHRLAGTDSVYDQSELEGVSEKLSGGTAETGGKVVEETVKGALDENRIYNQREVEGEKGRKDQAGSSDTSRSPALDVRNEQPSPSDTNILSQPGDIKPESKTETMPEPATEAFQASSEENKPKSRNQRIAEIAMKSPELEAESLGDAKTPDKEAIEMGKRYYRENLAGKRVYSPAFGEEGVFNSRGLAYILTRGSEADRARRLKLLPKAVPIIENQRHIDPEDIREISKGRKRYGLTGRFKDGSVVTVVFDEVQREGKKFLSIFDIEDLKGEKLYKKMGLPLPEKQPAAGGIVSGKHPPLYNQNITPQPGEVNNKEDDASPSGSLGAMAYVGKLSGEPGPSARKLLGDTPRKVTEREDVLLRERMRVKEKAAKAGEKAGANKSLTLTKLSEQDELDSVIHRIPPLGIGLVINNKAPRNVEPCII